MCPPSKDTKLYAFDGLSKFLKRAWRGGGPAPLRGRDRGALLEAICRLRARLGLVVFMYTPSHVGIVPNAYADAAAKSHLSEPWEGDSAQQAILPHVDEFRPVHNIASLAELAAALSREPARRQEGVGEWLRMLPA